MERYFEERYLPVDGSEKVIFVHSQITNFDSVITIIVVPAHASLLRVARI